MKNLFKKIIIPVITWQAMHLLGRHNPKIIAVTGSVGKTSTKEAIYHFLKTDFDVRRSEKSFNSEIGVPLTILGLKNAWLNPVGWFINIVKGFFTAFFSKEYPDVLVLEVGADKPGDIGSLVSWLKPYVAVITALPEVPVHVENFPSVQAVHKEKLKLAEALEKDGTLVFNADDHILVAAAGKLHAKEKITFGIKEKADVSLGMVSVPEFANPYPILAAAAVAKAMNVSVETIEEASKSFKNPSGRMNKLPGLNGATLIDDTYNSSPAATEFALSMLKEAKNYKRKIAVLGDMKELGEYAEKEHRRIGKLTAHSADILISVGTLAEWITDEAEKSGMKKENALDMRNSVDAGEYLKGIIKEGDLVLLKGSQSIRMEKAVLMILDQPERNSHLLVRQDKEWEKR